MMSPLLPPLLLINRRTGIQRSRKSPTGKDVLFVIVVTSILFGIYIWWH
jgi:hypothetical protein